MTSIEKHFENTVYVSAPLAVQNQYSQFVPYTLKPYKYDNDTSLGEGRNKINSRR